MKACQYSLGPEPTPDIVALSRQLGQQGRGLNMMTDTEIRLKGIEILAKHLGDEEAERFIALIQREPFDYTKWRPDPLARCFYNPEEETA